MITIKYIYNRNRKTTTKNTEEFTFNQMEREVKKIFNFGERPLLFYYYDETNLKILILDEDDFQDVCKLALMRIEPVKIYLNLREKIIEEIPNIELVQTIFLKEFLRRQMNLDGFHKKRLISDLHSLKESLQKAHFKHNLIHKILNHISKEIQTYFVEKSFSGSNELDEPRATDQKLPKELSFSSIRDKQTSSSFFSKQESVQPHRHNFRKNPPRFELIDENKELKIECRACLSDLSDQIRFECGKCRKFQLCDDCVEKTKHKHDLRPIFIINDSKQKINAINRIFKKLKFNRAEFFFEILKSRLMKKDQAHFN